jgi:hypothetical protein
MAAGGKAFEESKEYQEWQARKKALDTLEAVMQGKSATEEMKAAVRAAIVEAASVTDGGASSLSPMAHTIYTMTQRINAVKAPLAATFRRFTSAAEHGLLRGNLEDLLVRLGMLSPTVSRYDVPDDEALPLDTTTSPLPAGGGGGGGGGGAAAPVVPARGVSIGTGGPSGEHGSFVYCGLTSVAPTRTGVADASHLMTPATRAYLDTLPKPATAESPAAESALPKDLVEAAARDTVRTVGVYGTRYSELVEEAVNQLTEEFNTDSYGLSPHSLFAKLLVLVAGQNPDEMAEISMKPAPLHLNDFGQATYFVPRLFNVAIEEIYQKNPWVYGATSPASPQRFYYDLRVMAAYKYHAAARKSAEVWVAGKYDESELLRYTSYAWGLIQIAAAAVGTTLPAF